MLHYYLSETAKRYPNRVAVVHENGEPFTYRQIADLSNRVSHLILSSKEDVRTKPFVGIMSPVYAESIAVVIGALKIGCAYIPLDPKWDVKENKRIIDSLSLDIIFVDPEVYTKYQELLESYPSVKIVFLRKPLKASKGRHLSLNEIEKSADPKFNTCTIRENVAYIIHSSGSTGIPKPIMVTHKNACSFVDFMHKTIKMTNQDIVMSKAGFSFDPSVFDVFNTFKAGGKLICFDWNIQRDIWKKCRDYINLMEKHKATIMYTTPATFITLMQRGNFDEKMMFLKKAIYTGEPFPTIHLKKLKEMVPTLQTITNLYSPTEVNAAAYYVIKSLPKDNSPVPIGNPVEGNELLVVKDKDKICDPFEVGEIWCRGDNVMLGYLGNPKKTRGQLINSPFHQYPAIFYRSGDFGYLDDKGMLHYLGRRSYFVHNKNTIKDLDKISNVLDGHPSIDEFIIIPSAEGNKGGKFNIFYSLTDKINLSEEEIKDKVSALNIQQHLIERYIKTEYLPRTVSGKIDIKELARRIT